MHFLTVIMVNKQQKGHYPRERFDIVEEAYTEFNKTIWCKECEFMLKVDYGRWRELFKSEHGKGVGDLDSKKYDIMFKKFEGKNDVEFELPIFDDAKDGTFPTIINPEKITITPDIIGKYWLVAIDSKW